MTSPATAICALCANNHLLDVPMRNCCNAKIEQSHNVSCSTCFLNGNQHLCFPLDPLGMKFFHRLIALKHNGGAEFSERLEEFQVIIFYHLSILSTTTAPVKAWALDIPAETFAGASMLVKFGKGIPHEIPDSVETEDNPSSDSNSVSSDAISAIEFVTTGTGSPEQTDIDEPDYFVLNHHTNDKSDSEDEEWVSI